MDRTLTVSRYEAEFLLDRVSVLHPATRALAHKLAGLVLEYSAESALAAAAAHLATSPARAQVDPPRTPDVSPTPVLLPTSAPAPAPPVFPAPPAGSLRAFLTARLPETGVTPRA